VTVNDYILVSSAIQVICESYGVDELLDPLSGYSQQALKRKYADIPSAVPNDHLPVTTLLRLKMMPPTACSKRRKLPYSREAVQQG